MRILVFSQAAWNTANSFGNTATNWFDGWEDTHFFHFYARQQKPNTGIAEKYYHVSAVEILKNALRGKQAVEEHWSQLKWLIMKRLQIPTQSRSR